MSQAVNEVSCVIEDQVWQRLRVFHQLSKALNVILDSGDLFDMIELVDEKFVLVTAKALVDHVAKSLPIMRKMSLDGLEPTSRSANEVMGRNSDPNLRGNRLHFEVILSTSDPQLRVITVKLWEIHLGEATKVEIMGQWGLGEVGVYCGCGIRDG